MPHFTSTNTILTARGGSFDVEIAISQTARAIEKLDRIPRIEVLLGDIQFGFEMGDDRRVRRENCHIHRLHPINQPAVKPLVYKKVVGTIWGIAVGQPRRAVTERAAR